MCKFRSLLSVSFIAMCASMLTACQSSTPPLPTAIKPPADLVQPCPNLPKLEGGTGADVLPWSLQVIGLYNDCKARHKALSDTFK
ncbi:Rz1-like lysis system protein LysC [Neisseria sp. P0008.S004]|uniref:Rz1-like lysis system protein LysC n=1 Tax=Neisseria sp. P0008.S004 TaxID=3436701 RepID=UPI003F7F6D20